MSDNTPKSPFDVFGNPIGIAGQLAVGQVPESVDETVSGIVSDAASAWIPQGVRNTLLNRGFWVRAGTVVAGFFVVWVGILVILWGNKTFRSTVTGAATGGTSLAADAAGSIVKGLSE